jgi:uncharacterized membrane protein
MLYPMGRNLASGFSLLLFGSIFTAAGWFLIRYEGHWFMGGLFGGIGLLVVMSALYFVLNSLEVRQDGGDIRTIRRILGIAVKHGRMRRADFVNFEKKTGSKTQTGRKHVVNYAVQAVDRHGRKLVIGEGFKGSSQADAAADYIGRQFGLTPQRKRAAGDDAVIEDYDLLATD